MILTLFVFALSYFVRPIDGLLFGWLADKKSLTSAYRLSLLCMEIPAFIIALLPVSFLSPEFTLFVFIVLRLVQGIAVGGEFPLLALYLNRAASKKQVFNTVFTVASAVSGLMLGTFVVAILHQVFDAQVMLMYGWRIGFMIAALLAVAIYFIQRYALLEVEAPGIVVPKTKNGINKEKIINIMALFLFVGFTELVFYTGFVWFPVYLQHFHLLSAGNAFFNNAVSLLLMIVLTLFFAYKIKPQHVFTVIRVGIVLTIIMFIILLNTMVHEPHILLLLTLLLALVFSLIQSVLYFIVCQLTKIFSGKSKVIAFRDCP